jgi:hypothetical protein
MITIETAFKKYVYNDIFYLNQEISKSIFYLLFNA